MANVTTYLRSSLLNKLVEIAAFIWSTGAIAIANAAAANGDRMQIFTVTRNMRLMQAIMAVDATLGASCTIKLQRDRSGVFTDLTIATTAGGASIVTSATLGAFDLIVGDVITVLVGGAAVGAAANVTIDLLVQST